MNRTEIILKLVKGKEVLDVGCASVIKSGRLFIEMEKVTRSITGVDINPKGVNYMWGKGYNVFIGDFETKKLHKKFEIVVAGDIIEHTKNQGNFIENCEEHLKKNGRIILSTANPFAGRVIIRAILGMRLARANTEHTLYTGEGTLRVLLDYYDLEMERVIYCFDEHKNVRTTIEKTLFSCIKRFMPSWITVIKRKKDE